MQAATHDLPIDPPNSTNSTTGNTESNDTVEILEDLLVQSIRLRDVYKNARWQTPDVEFRRLRQLFDGHYQEQIRLVDVLIDRIRTLNGSSGVFAGDFLHPSQVSQLLRGRASITRLLVDLVDAHESVLNAVLPILTGDGQVDPPWTRDFAVGQVVLSNDQQLFALREQLMHREGTQRTEANWDY